MPKGVDLGDAVRALRAEKGLSKEAFGEELGVSIRTIYNWERGRVPPLARLALAAYLYGLRPWPADKPVA